MSKLCAHCSGVRGGRFLSDGWASKDVVERISGPGVAFKGMQLPKVDVLVCPDLLRRAYGTCFPGNGMVEPHDRQGWPSQELAEGEGTICLCGTHRKRSGWKSWFGASSRAPSPVIVGGVSRGRQGEYTRPRGRPWQLRPQGFSGAGALCRWRGFEPAR